VPRDESFCVINFHCENMLEHSHLAFFLAGGAFIMCKRMRIMEIKHFPLTFLSHISLLKRSYKNVLSLAWRM
jgi:hypothetical protein